MITALDEATPMRWQFEVVRAGSLIAVLRRTYPR